VISSEPWGEVDGRPVELYTLASGRGMTVRIATFGGTVQSLLAPDRSGSSRNVALGFSSLERYVANLAAPGASGRAYFGAIVGRYANRIAGPGFVLDGERFELAGNTGPDNSVSMHGGPGGYSAQVWDAAPAVDGFGLRLTLLDRAGRNGFPGAVANEVLYEVTPDNALRIDYTATADAPTVVSLTNHTYFNLAGEGSGSCHDQLMAINARVVQTADEMQIPVGFASVAGTPFDFRAMKPIGRDLRGVGEPGGSELGLARGYDDNWVLAGRGYRLAAVAFDAGSGIALWTYTDQPGLQFYTGNFLAGELVGPSGRPYGQGDAFALETQHFPDSPNHIGDPRWPSVVLRPGQVMRSRTAYKFTVSGPELAGRVRFS
jgi:aldose 1-epimerase